MHMNKVKSQGHTVRWGKEVICKEYLECTIYTIYLQFLSKPKMVWLFMDTRAMCEGMLVAPGTGWRGRVPRRKTAVGECLKAS